jgi:hypothetical protein
LLQVRGQRLADFLRPTRGHGLGYFDRRDVNFTGRSRNEMSDLFDGHIRSNFCCCQPALVAHVSDKRLDVRAPCIFVPVSAPGLPDRSGNVGKGFRQLIIGMGNLRSDCVKKRRANAFQQWFRRLHK